MAREDRLRQQAAHLAAAVRGQGQAASDSSTLRRLRAPGVDVSRLAETLGRWYEEQGFEAQVLPQPGAVVVQCRQRGRWKAAVGMSVSLTVVLRPEREDLAVEISGAKWLDKGFVTGAGLVAGLPFLLAPAAWGAWVQARLPDRTIDFLQATIPSHAGRRPDEGVGGNSGFMPLPSTLDVNLATAQELATLPGVTLIMAKKAVDARDRRGGFQRVDDFIRVLADDLPPHVVQQVRSVARAGAGAIRQPAADVSEAADSGQTASSEPGRRRIDE